MVFFNNLGFLKKLCGFDSELYPPHHKRLKSFSCTAGDGHPHHPGITVIYLKLRLPIGWIGRDKAA